MLLNYKQFGQGDPLIILHGLFGTLDNWQTLAKRFAEEHTVFIIDQRNHGKSPHTLEHSYTLMAEDLREFMEAQFMFKAHVLGHSMGGKTVMQFALLYPDMVDKLTVVDISPRANTGGHELIFKALFDLDLAKIESRKEADAALSVLIKEVGVRQFLLKNLTRKKEGGYRWKMNLEALFNHYSDILAAVESEDTFAGETLFIRGGKSDYVPDEDLPLIKKYFPRARLETVAQAGHWVHAAQPDELFDLVTDFLKND